MSQLIETIRCEDGAVLNAAYHQARAERSLLDVFGVSASFDIERIVKGYSIPPTGVFKCRLTYDNKSHNAEFIPYVIKPAKTLKLVHDNEIEYKHKSVDRQAIQRLFDMREHYDDILIVKQGLITDSSIANIVFRTGPDWFTPSSCLLEGTMRQNLLDGGQIRTQNIGPEDIRKYDAFKLINAMMLFDSEEISVYNIVA